MDNASCNRAWGNHEQTAHEGTCLIFPILMKVTMMFLTMYVLLKSGNWLTLERMRGYSLIFLVMSMMAVIVLWTYPLGMLDQMGRPKGTDFSNPYSAGKMSLDGRAAEAYDFVSHYSEQQKIFSADENLPFYGWHYPPIFFLVAAPLALLPYMFALLLWVFSTFLAYLAMMKNILPHRMTLLVAAAFPAVFVTISHGQNSFLTAACLGFGLALIKGYPVIAGIFFGILSYKPHFGILLPLVILSGRHWRTFFMASITVIILVGMTLYFFGWESWIAFGNSQELTRTYVLEQVATGWEKIQSAFSFSRSLGWSIRTSYLVQIAIALPTVIILSFLWFRGLDEPACAATATGTLLITPYVLDYDMAVLSISLAFLVSHGLKNGFLPWEKTLLVSIWIVPGVTRVLAMKTGIPLGLIGLMMIFSWSVYRSLKPTEIFKETAITL